MKLTNQAFKEIITEVQAWTIDPDYLNSTLKAKIESILTPEIPEQIKTPNEIISYHNHNKT